MNWLLVFTGGMVGAVARYLTDRAVGARRGTAFPWGMFTVNVTGCALAGVLTGAVVADAAPDGVRLFLGTGLCGALTTYSTFSWETLRLAESGARRLAAANALGGVAAGLAATYAGVALAGTVWG
ncbi:fluoride efflux transporter CrcB [Streptomyces specialis]|uniref:fluoride efflux transporter CrcB n=1 Tax=Streptomyces specialis TaxID=498367 RepID=UPI00073F7DB1|nr:fluoride efflux transporter CrcB [Streptomyces specialis]